MKSIIAVISLSIVCVLLSFLLGRYSVKCEPCPTNTPIIKYTERQETIKKIEDEIKNIDSVITDAALVTIKGQGIHSENCLTLDSNEVIYTIKQDLNCIKCLMQAPLKDSLISQYQYQVKTADTIINSLQFANQELTTKIEVDKVELKKRRKNVFKYSIISFVTGFIISIFAL